MNHIGDTMRKNGRFIIEIKKIQLKRRLYAMVSFKPRTETETAIRYPYTNHPERHAVRPLLGQNKGY